MKRMRKIAAVLLALALMLSLAACGSFETRMAKAARKMEKLQSWRMDMDMDMEMSMGLLGESVDLDIAVAGTADINSDPLKMKMDMNMQVMGEALNILSYYEQDGDDYMAYVSPDGGNSWAKQSVDGDQLPVQDVDMSDYTMLLKLASRFEKTGTETVKGAEATVFSGVIEGEEIGEAVELSGVLSALGSALNMDLDDLDESSTGAIPTTIAIDNKSGMIVKFTMDMTEIMQNLLPAMLDEMMAEIARESGLEGFDLGALGFTLDIGRVMVSEVLYDFDAVDAIEIPEAARSAEELGDIAA
ncbi:MAG: hypothetical protein IJV41_00235 [Oscillospiraceae bacterium]|nr:hypothetical protein [Oscillospiraceae bacterium]